MVQYFRNEMQSDYEIWLVNRRQHEKHFFKNQTQNVLEELFPDAFLKNQN